MVLIDQGKELRPPLPAGSSKMKEKPSGRLRLRPNYLLTKELLVIGGEFNAQCGSAYHHYINNMGQYGKDIVNENGYELRDLCQRNNLILTNTIVKHKLSHITTWQSPENPETMTRYGTLRQNPIRTQIDYIIVRKADLKLVTNSRSYSSINTRTDID